MQLESIPGYLLASAWPATHVVAGLRVSRSVRLHLLDHADKVAFSVVQSLPCPLPTRTQITDDFGRFHNTTVSFALRVRCPTTASLLLENLDCAGRGKLAMIDVQCQFDSDKLEGLATGLRSNPCLTSLTLNDFCMGCEGIAVLAAELETRNVLSHLELSRNGLGDSSMPSICRILQTNPRMSHLVLSLNKLGPCSAEQLASVLARCSCLQHLDLSTNYLGPHGAGHLAGALEGSTALTSLNLSDNGLGRVGSSHIAELLPRCSALRQLNMKNNAIGALAGELRTAHLVHLDLSGNRLRDDGAAILADHTHMSWAQHLQALNLSCNGIGSDGATRLSDALAGCGCLGSLDLSENCLGAAGVGAVGALAAHKPPLARLALAFCAPRDEGARLLAEGLQVGQQTSLTWLSLRGCGIGDAGVSVLLGALRALKNLKHLDLARNLVRDPGARAVCLALDPAPSSAFPTMAGFKALTELDLSGNEIRTDGGRLLREMLAKRVSSPLRLAMVGNDVDPKAARGVHKQCSMPVYY